MILLVPPDNATPIPPFPADALRFKPHGDIENFFRRKIPAFPLLFARLFVLGLPSPSRRRPPPRASIHNTRARAHAISFCPLSCLFSQSFLVPAFAVSAFAQNALKSPPLRRVRLLLRVYSNSSFLPPPRRGNAPSCPRAKTQSPSRRSRAA